MRAVRAFQRRGGLLGPLRTADHAITSALLPDDLSNDPNYQDRVNDQNMPDPEIGDPEDLRQQWRDAAAAAAQRRESGSDGNHKQ